MARQSFKIYGMDCADEVAILKREIGPLVGGEEQLSFDILQGKMSVVATGDAAIDSDRILRAVSKTGMGAQVWADGAVPPGALPGAKSISRPLMTGISGVLLVLGFATHAAGAGLMAAFGNEGMGPVEAIPVVPRLLYLGAIAAGMWVVLPKAWFALRSLRPDMNLLMTVAVLGAIGINQWLEGATVAFLFAVSLLLESWSIGRARRAVEALLAATPSTVRVRFPDGREEVQQASDVQVGARFIVRLGEKIPLDGLILAGDSGVNQAPITGESLPVEKGPGAEVYAGTLNGDGVLEVESTKPANQTLLANIIRMIGEAQSKRAPSEQWVERFARSYTPAVMAVSLLVFLIPPLLFAGSWDASFYRALVLLVIACPCALVISTPVSIVAALAAAAKNGALIKGGVYVEAPSRLVAIAMDKTGTLTEGRPRVVEIVPLAGQTKEELLGVAAALEAHTTHPLAHAILQEADRLKIASTPAVEVQEIKGKGLQGVVNGTRYWLGSHRYLEERGSETPEVHARLDTMASAGQSIIVVGTETAVSGFIAVADTLRPEAASTVAALRALGVKHIVMLTGDNRGTAEAIAAQVGVDEIRAEMLPADKVDAVTDLVKKYGQVAMVGDGVNDAPALAVATLGIAMGAAGSDAAIEAADIALMGNSIALLPWLVDHSRRTLMVIKQNIGFSLAVKAVFVVLTAVGLASLWGAIFADMVASLLVIANGLRLLNAPPAITPAASCPIPEAG